MVIEVSGVLFGLKSYAWFQNWKHKYDFRPKLHNTKFNYHFITSIYYTCNLICYFKQDLKPVGRAVLMILFHCLGKKYDLEQKMVRFGNISHCWEPIRLHKSPVISKWMK